jgi:hypothetical protein
MQKKKKRHRLQRHRFTTAAPRGFLFFNHAVGHTTGTPPVPNTSPFLLLPPLLLLGQKNDNNNNHNKYEKGFLKLLVEIRVYEKKFGQVHCLRK